MIHEHYATGKTSDALAYKPPPPVEKFSVYNRLLCGSIKIARRIYLIIMNIHLITYTSNRSKHDYNYNVYDYL